MQLQSARSPNPQSQPCCSLIPDKQDRRQQINYDKIRGICSNSLFPKSEKQTLLRLLTLLIGRTRETKAKVNLCGGKTPLAARSEDHMWHRKRGETWRRVGMMSSASSKEGFVPVVLSQRTLASTIPVKL